MTETRDSLRRKALRNRSPVEALAWLDARYTGSSKAALVHQMYADPGRAVMEMRLRSELQAIIRPTVQS